MSSQQPEAPQAKLPVATGRQVWTVCWGILRKRWWLVALGAVCFVIASACGLVLPFALGRVVDFVDAGTGTPGDVWALAGLIAAAAVVGAAMFALGTYISSLIVERLLAGLREDLVSQSLRLPPRVVEQSGTGDVVSRSSEDVAQVSEALPTTIPMVASSVFTIALTAVGMSLLNPWFALTFAVVLPIHIWAARWYLRNAPQVYAAERVAMAQRAQHLLASLRALPTVQSFGLATVHAAQISDASWAAVRWTMRARAVVNTLFARINMAEFFGMSTILIVGFLLVNSGRATVGAATTAMLFFLQLFGPIGTLLMVIDTLQSALASLMRIVGVRYAPFDEAELRTIGGEVPASLQSIEFGYTDSPVVKDLNWDLHAGERVALVGSSGAGKSTVASLVAGWHQPWTGTVQISESAAARTVLITQEVHLFGGSVRENLTLVAPQATDDDVAAALATVGATSVVESLPDGLDTQIGPHGRDLTVASAQLLALARAHLANPELVLLDEATAEAGSLHGDELDAAARAVMAGRAGIIIAHRLDQAADADRIVVMEHGTIVEQGSHAQLVAADGTYAELWGAWQQYRGA